MPKNLQVKDSKPEGQGATPVPSRFQHPSWVVFGLAGVLALAGQLTLLTGLLGLGLGITTLAVLVFLVGLAGDARLAHAWAQVRAVLTQVAQRLEPSAEGTAPVASRPRPIPVAPPARTVLSSPTPLPVIAPTGPLLFDPRTWPELKVPKRWLMLAGIALILLCQPLLFLERYVPALALFLPGAALLLYALLSKRPALVLGAGNLVLRVGLVGAAGLALVGVGQLLIWNTLEANLALELLGLSCNAAGILLLLTLLPKHLTDPEPEVRSLLDLPTGEARNQTGLWVKLAWIGGSAVLFLLMTQVSTAPAYVFKKTMLALGAIAALGMSFPWNLPSGVFTPAGTTPDALTRTLRRFLRLGAFAAALYLGYRGQQLFAQEQVFPAIYQFAAAGLALLLALREPKPGSTDAEAPLAWQWELAGLLLILGVGIFLRVYLLDKMPYGVECDEAGAAAETLDVVENQFASATVHPCGRQLFMLLPNVVAYTLLGHNSVGIRFMAMFFGVVGILCMYLMARYFYGPRVALLSAALFAVSRWHIHFSRFGWSNTLMLVLLMLGFFLLVKGLKSRNKWHFVLSGMAFSLTVQTETAARMVPIICLFLLGYFAFAQRHFFKRNWRPLVALMLGVWLAGAGIYLFWLHKPNMLYKRVYEVSIFSQDPNAPKANVTQGFLDSAKGNLTQMNWHGDYRTRHNGGLSGEPVLDFWTAILFALGFAFSLYYWKRLRYFLPLVWFFGFMAASIFSMEAPQSHRAFGIFPTIFLFIAAFLDRARRLLRETLGPKAPAVAGLGLALLLIPITQTNAKKYFDAYPAFDTNVTAVAKYMGAVWPRAEQVVMTAYTWLGHPPFRVYVRPLLGHLYYASSEALPYRLDKHNDVLYSLVMEYPPLLPSVQWFYPNGKFHEENHFKYGLQFQAWGVTRAEIEGVRGLRASYRAEGQTLERRDPALNFVWDEKSWPLPGAGSVTWEGTLLVPHEGTYTFDWVSTDDSQIEIGSRVRLESGGGQEAHQTRWMAGGLHRLRARATHRTPGGRLQFAWSCTQPTTYYLYDDPHAEAFLRQPVPTTHLYTYREPAGLLATFYRSPNWTGQPAVQKVEPALLFFWTDSPYNLGPFSADFRGWLNVPKSGEYRFELEQGGFGEILIDGQAVVRNGPLPTGVSAAPLGKNPVYLEAGRHPVNVRWACSGGWILKWWWTPPGGERALVPAGVLSPAEE